MTTKDEARARIADAEESAIALGRWIDDHWDGLSETARTQATAKLAAQRDVITGLRLMVDTIEED